MKQAQITAEYIDHSGSDLMVVNAARASFGKESSWAPSSLPEEDSGRKLKQADASLIRFLATGYRTSEWEDFLIQVEGTVVNGTAKDLTDLLHAYKRKAQHFAPFAHPHLTIRMSLPIFLARQFVKHQVGGCITGDTLIYFERVNAGADGVKKMTMADIFQKWHKKTPHSRHGDEYG